jgi:hypothetical protein
MALSNRRNPPWGADSIRKSRKPFRRQPACVTSFIGIFLPHMNFDCGAGSQPSMRIAFYRRDGAATPQAALPGGTKKLLRNGDPTCTEAKGLSPGRSRHFWEFCQRSNGVDFPGKHRLGT